jgi:hypothetical protein
MRERFAVGLVLVCLGGCSDPRAAEDLDRRTVAEVNALADALDKDDAAAAAARLAALRGLVAAAKRVRVSKADNEALIAAFRGPQQAAADRLTKAAAAAKARGKIRLEDLPVPP